MFTLLGTDAYPAFRLRQLEEAASRALGFPVSLQASWIYLLDAPAGLGDADVVRASELLEAVGRASPREKGAVYVAPRKGTISPWSSKASDIFRSCGLGKLVRRVERAIVLKATRDGRPVPPAALAPAFPALHDRMTEGVYDDLSDLFAAGEPKPGRVFDVLAEGRAAIEKANVELGLALYPDEIDYLADCCAKAGKNPTDTEIVMFGQVNSEHCRHKIFNASWTLDGTAEELSLFKMIRHTHESHPQGTLVAYSDNSGVIEGFRSEAFVRDPATRAYRFEEDQVDILMKVETHNHPTAISPFPGAATGVGGEIRDESATGVGSRSKCGICGFMVSNLRIPGHALPWERETSAPARLASPLAIMLEGPIGGAAFGNEFGRPQLCGFFRTFEAEADGRSWGYDKPIMLAGGMGNIRRSMALKKDIPEGSLIVQIGGPAMRIGLGGGAASSLVLGSNDAELDFNSVQRGNAEMQRRCQEVIDECVALGAERNPILSIHDLGAGGLSNGCPELVEKTGGRFDLRAVHNEEPAMTPMEIWCCEAQERYVLAIDPAAREFFEKLCERERCPVAFIGVATGDHRLVLEDSHFGDKPIDMDVGMLLGKPPRMHRDATRRPVDLPPVAFASPAVRSAPLGGPAAEGHTVARSDGHTVETPAEEPKERDARRQTPDEIPAAEPIQHSAFSIQHSLPKEPSDPLLAEFEALAAKRSGAGDATPSDSLRSPAPPAGEPASAPQAAEDMAVPAEMPAGEPASAPQAPADLAAPPLGELPPKAGEGVAADRATVEPCDRVTAPAEPEPPPVAPEAADALWRVLSHPTVADKTFLITIADRTVTGMVHRDQMCGPFQLPVADNAVVTTGYKGYDGAAMACGERAPVAVVDAPASGRLAVAEAVLNLASAGVPEIGQIKLSANWMAACGEPGQDAALFDTVRAVAMEFCPAAGLSIPVGKDSCSMSTVWSDGGAEHRQLSPVSLVVSAFGPVPDVRVGVTPDLKPVAGSSLLLVDLAQGRRRLAGSILAQCWNLVGGDVPDFDDPARLVAFYGVFQRLLRERKLLAAHDRSDGGLAAAVAEMAMAGGCGVSLRLPSAGTQQDVLAVLFNEEPGMVVQVADADLDAVAAAFEGAGLPAQRLGPVDPRGRFLTATFGETIRLDVPMARVRAVWSENSCRMRELRDNPDAARAERENAADENLAPMSFALTFEPEAVPNLANPDARPRVAILREEGVNGHVEMAAAFTFAGFEAVDVHTTDLLEGRADLKDFHGLVACGGFSYGDVLGAGSGWANTILFNDRLREMFEAYFARPQTFTLGVCNGCQMVSQLRDIIPGASDWPRFIHNRSMQFEARYATVEVMKSPSILLQGMEGSRLPIAVAHGEGFARFGTGESRARVLATERASLRYVDGAGAPTERYPFNPNGSEDGLTGFTTLDGRATIMMPHPERGFRSVQLSWRPAGFCDGESGPWMRMFRNARSFVG